MIFYYKRLKKDIDSCVENGILKREEAEKAYSFILSKKKNMQNASTIIIVIGAALIAFGIGLIISYNWDKIDALIKIVAYLVAYGACGFLAIKFPEKKDVRIPAEVLWFFMPAFGLGLYGQIFQLSLDPVTPFMVWVIISAPMVWFSSKKYLNFLIELLVYLVFLMSIFYTDSVFSITSKNFADIYFFLTLAFAASAFLFLSAAYKKLSNEGKIPSRIYAAALAYMCVFTLVHINLSNLFIMLGFASAAVAIVDEEFSYPYFRIFAILVYIFSSKYFHREHKFDGTQLIIGIKYVLAIVFSAVAYILATIRIMRFRETVLAYPILIILGFSLLKTVDLFSGNSDIFIFNILAIWLFIASIIHGTKQLDKRFVNLGISMTALLIISRFIDLFSNIGFLKTGFGFIISGSILILGAYYVNIWRKKLIKDMEGK